MPSMNVRIGKRVVDQAQPVEGRDLYLRDTELKGFGLRVYPAGVKSYFVEYRMGGRGTEKSRVVIGKHGSPWTPDMARQRAGEILREVKQGINPAVEKRHRNRIAVDLAFEKYVETFIDVYAKKHQPRSWDQAQSVLRLHAVPKLKGRPLPEITRKEIKGLLDDVASEHPATARYLYAILHKLFRWAVEREDDLLQSPMTGMTPPAPVVSRDRVLSDDELRACWRAAEGEGGLFGALVHLLIATGQRREEVAGMSWSEIDRERCIWTVPADRAKNGKANIVPLSERAMAVLDGLDPAKKKRRGLVLSTTGRTPISGISKFKRRLDTAMAAQMVQIMAEGEREGDVPEIAAWRFHDLRRTVATNFQRLGIRFEVTEAVLNHVSGSKSGVAGVYQRHDWAEEKAAALAAWSRRIDLLLSPGRSADNVLTFGSASA